MCVCMYVYMYACMYNITHTHTHTHTQTHDESGVVNRRRTPPDGHCWTRGHWWVCQRVCVSGHTKCPETASKKAQDGRRARRHGSVRMQSGGELHSHGHSLDGGVTEVVPLPLPTLGTTLPLAVLYRVSLALCNILRVLPSLPAPAGPCHLLHRAAVAGIRNICAHRRTRQLPGSMGPPSI